MATDLERLVLQMSADIRGVQKSMDKAYGIVDSRTRKMERRFQMMSSTASSSLGRIGAAFGAAFGVRAAQQLLDASTRITNALKVAGLEGDALKRVYDSLYESAQRNAAPLEELVTLYGRAAIVQKELGVTSEELLNFTDKVALALRVAGTSAESSRGALLQLSQALGSGTVRAEEFNSILEGALPVAQAAAAGLEEAGGSVAKLRGLIINGKVSSEAFFRAFEAGSVMLEEKVSKSQLTVAQGFTRIYNASIDAVGKINEGTGAGERLAKALDDVSTSIKNADFSPLIDGLVGVIKAGNKVLEILAQMDRGAKRAGEAVGADKIGKAIKSGTLGRDIEDGLRNVLGANSAERVASAFDRTANMPIENTERRGQAGMRGTPKPVATVKPVSLGDFKPPPKVGDGSGREDAWKRETRQIQEATEAQRLELSLIGQTEKARDKARAMLELENAAKRANITLTDEQRMKIEEMSTAYADSAESVRKAEERMEAINRLQQEFGQLAADGIMSLIDGSKTLNEVLADTIKRLAQMAIEAMVFGTIKQMFGMGTGGGGFLSSLFGGFFSEGGNLGAGKWGIAGEKGPEIIKGPATVVPIPKKVNKPGAQQLQADIRVAVDDEGSLRAYVERTSIATSAAVTRENNRRIPTLVADKSRRM